MGVWTCQAVEGEWLRVGRLYMVSNDRWGSVDHGDFVPYFDDVKPTHCADLLSLLVDESIRTSPDIEFWTAVAGDAVGTLGEDVIGGTKCPVGKL